MITKSKRIKKGKSYQAVLFSIIIGILVFGAIGFLVFSSFKINQRRTELISKIESIKEEIQTLEKKNEELRAGIIQTQDETFWEEKIREQGYKKLGEETVVVLPPEEGGEKPEEKEKSFLQKLLEKFGF